jgi:hypothetical protein
VSISLPFMLMLARQAWMYSLRRWYGLCQMQNKRPPPFAGDTNAQDGEGQSDHAVDELRHTNDQRKSTLIITKIKSMTDARGVS